MSHEQTTPERDRHETYKWKLFEYYFLSLLCLVTAAFTAGLVITLHLTSVLPFGSSSTIMMILMSVAFVVGSVSYAVLFINTIVERR